MAKTIESSPIREERIKSETSIKIIYEFEDSKKGIKKISKEKFLNKDIEVHYPWGFFGGEKYPNVIKFIYEGFEKKLPVGVQKSATYGYGFLKSLKPVGEYLGKELKIKTVRIIKSGVSNIDIPKHLVTFTETDLRTLYDVFEVKEKQQQQEIEKLTQQQLQVIYPKAIKDVEYLYVKNSIADVINTWSSSINDFSESDRVAIKSMFDKLSLHKGFFTSETLLSTKEKIDAKYIEDVIKEFEDLMKITTDSDATERKWQGFLQKHSWIFSFVFSFPIILFQEEAYVGGKSISNKGGKLNDFLIKNNLTENVAFIEIKTHNTSLIKSGKPYRGKDVFSISDDLSGGIAQVLDQRDNFQKHFATLKMDTDDAPFESFNSKCIVLMGQIKALKNGKLKSFELTRSNSKDVEILTFDELFARLQNLQKLILGKVKPTTKSGKKAATKKVSKKRR